MKQKVGAESLEEKILHRAQEQGEKMVDRSKKIAERIIRQAERRRDELIAKFKANAEQDAAQYKKKLESALRLDLKRLVSQKEAALIEKIVEDAKIAIVEKFRNNPALYLKWLYKLIKEGVAVLGQDYAAVHVSEKDRGLLTMSKLSEFSADMSTELGKGVSLSLVANDKPYPQITCGATIYTLDGRNFYDNSLEGLLRRAKEELRWELYEKLSAE